jgi:AraC-like DNA-binding protein
MTPHYLVPGSEPNHSFSIRRDTSPDINSRCHYHDELELVYFIAGSGVQFIGDNVRRFKAGDMVLLGPRIPHYWRYDECYAEGSATMLPESVVLHFRADFWGDAFLNLPENAPIKQLVTRAGRGLQIFGQCKRDVAALLEDMTEMRSLNRVSALVNILSLIAVADEVKKLCSAGYQTINIGNGDRRINTVCEYLFTHYQRRISLTEIAAVANVSPYSFGRFFKSRTRRTYSWFLAEIRVAQACKLMMNDDFDNNLKKLASDSGFQSYDMFFKCFKAITGMQPSVYQRKYNLQCSSLIE